MKSTLAALCSIVGLSAGAGFAQQAPTSLPASPALKAPPANLLPTGVAGSVVYVHDLEAEKTWYETMLGFHVQNTYARNGKTFEYIMVAGSGGPGAPIMGIAQNDLRPAGYNANSRVVLATPDPKALADYLARQGIWLRVAIPNTAYMVFDPEGNPIELYHAPAAPPPKTP